MFRLIKMSGSAIFETVIRVFQSLGIYLIFGGIFMWYVLDQNKATIHELIAKVDTTYAQVERPYGLGHIPINDDPQYAEFPLDTLVYSIVSYEFMTENFVDTVISYGYENWETGQEISVRIKSSEPHLPYYDVSPGADYSALFIGIGIIIVGILLTVVAGYSIRERRRDHRLMAEMLIPNKPAWKPPDTPANTVIYSYKSSGNWFIGGIMVVIGSAICLLMANEMIVEGEYMKENEVLLFPAGLGVLFLYLGLREIYFVQTDIYSNSVMINYKGLPYPRVIQRPMSEFLGIDENVTEVKRTSSREFYKDFVLVHEDPTISGVLLQRLREKEATLEKTRQLSVTIGLPLIIQDAEGYRYEDSVRARETEVEDLSLQPFPGKYLKIKSEEPFEVVRSYSGSLYWAAGLLATGIIVWILAESMVVLVPAILMALIFTGISFKSDRLILNKGNLTIENSFFSKPYSSHLLKAAEVRQITVSGDIRRNNSRSLVIKTVDRQVVFGQACTMEELKWLRDKIKRLVAQ